MVMKQYIIAISIVLLQIVYFFYMDKLKFEFFLFLCYPYNMCDVC